MKVDSQAYHILISSSWTRPGCMTEWLSGSFQLLTPLSTCNIKYRKPNCSLTSGLLPKPELGMPVLYVVFQVWITGLNSCVPADVSTIEEFINQLCRTRQQFIGALTASIFTAWLVNFYQFGGVTVAITESCVCHGARWSAFQWLIALAGRGFHMGTVISIPNVNNAQRCLSIPPAYIHIHRTLP